jgi:hypothetical protein
MAKEVQVAGRKAFLTAEEVYARQAGGTYVSRGFVGYWSLAEPGLLSGESVKDSRGRTVIFTSVDEAEQAAEQGARGIG